MPVASIRVLCSSFNALLQLFAPGRKMFFYLCVRDRGARIVYGFLHLLTEPLVIGCGFVRRFHSTGRNLAAMSNLEGSRIEPGGIHLVLGHTDSLEVAHKRFKLAEDANRTTLCGQGAFGHAVLDNHTPSSGLTDDICTIEGVSFDEQGQSYMVYGFAGSYHIITY